MPSSSNFHTIGPLNLNSLTAYQHLYMTELNFCQESNLQLDRSNVDNEFTTITTRLRWSRRQKRNDSSDFQKVMIISFQAKGGSISVTAKFVNCSHAVVVKVYPAKWDRCPKSVTCTTGHRRQRSTTVVWANRRATVKPLSNLSLR
ncbi:hypothetical protein TNCV_4160041 [Trichonephila clavipes]|nr:hypothetical protein TNCV_4160041 [Trichonephila clavipes]